MNGENKRYFGAEKDFGGRWKGIEGEWKGSLFKGRFKSQEARNKNPSDSKGKKERNSFGYKKG
jgi:hypothetical protein